MLRAGFFWQGCARVSLFLLTVFFVHWAGKMLAMQGKRGHMRWLLSPSLFLFLLGLFMYG